MSAPQAEESIIPNAQKPGFGKSAVAAIKGPFRWTVILGGLGMLAVVGSMYWAGGKKDNGPASTAQGVRSPANADTMGPNAQTPAMQQAFREDEERRVEAAMRNNSSVSPVISRPMSPREAVQQPEVAVRAVPAEAPPAQQIAMAPRATPEMIDAIRQQQRELIQKWAQKPKSAQIKMNDEKQNQGAASQAEPSGSVSAASAAQGPVLARAVAIYYAVAGNSANSDRPGPVKAKLLSGPLKDAELIGSFQRVDEVLVIKYTTLSMPDGTEKQVDGYAIDPNSAEPGVAGEVDRRYMERYVLPLAASFIQGFGQAVARAGTTTTTGLLGTTTSTGPTVLKDQIMIGVGEAGASAGRLITENKPNGPLVTMKVGDPLGIMFIKSVR